MVTSLYSSVASVESAGWMFGPRSILPSKQNHLWKIESGVVRTLTWLEDSTVTALGLWIAGDVVGKPLSSVEPYQIECLTKVEASLVPVDRSHQETAVLLAHIQQLEELAVIRSYKKVDAMLVKLLNWLANKCGREVEKGRLIDLRLTHQDLAEMLSTTRVTITRTLNQLEQQGLIQRLPVGRIVLQEKDIWHYEI